ncbi:DUF2147 domain-containing protein [Pseudohoeflea coraliihabitans]|uniref:DUF2147 domain-containing protein n=1 Tax=Pseudohoeflea coraliihabitans TaxID=2860393 RepID=A0ABS6WIE0_9HYPH|nr:DUF2147 domain-containing protein [Pseudohoeflea sp. DP4N28-3]MBW3095722.1 DUF2147 domain-containing protein [Pseudohoeflea sp. DP4N28-3]
MIRTTTLALALTALMAGPALADPIEGKWRTKSGETAAISKCGGAYCVTLTTGAHKGKQIGRVSGSGGKYKGTITDPKKDKTYAGNATLNGNSLKMQGCVAKILCRSENWKRL